MITAVPGNNIGMNQGATPIAGKIGGAYNFQNNAQINVYPMLSPLGTLSSNTISVSAWINPSVQTYDYAKIADKGAEPPNKDFSLQMGKVGSNQVGFLVYNNILGSEKSVWSKTQVPANQWTHVVGTYDEKTMKIYINGKLDNFTPASMDNGVGWKIGSAVTIGNEYQSDAGFNGSIDEVKIWNYAISAAEVSQAAAVCDSNTDCGISGFVGSPTCKSKSVYQNYTTYMAGTPKFRHSFYGFEY